MQAQRAKDEKQTEAEKTAAQQALLQHVCKSDESYSSEQESDPESEQVANDRPDQMQQAADSQLRGGMDGV